MADGLYNQKFFGYLVYKIYLVVANKYKKAIKLPDTKLEIFVVEVKILIYLNFGRIYS